MIKSGRNHAANLAKQGKKIASYNFLGFTCYWGKSRFGTTWRLKYITRRDRFTEKLKGLRQYLRCQLNKQDKHRYYYKSLELLGMDQLSWYIG